jgi:hypothetical protein
MRPNPCPRSHFIGTLTGAALIHAARAGGDDLDGGRRRYIPGCLLAAVSRLDLDGPTRRPHAGWRRETSQRHGHAGAGVDTSETSVGVCDSTSTRAAHSSGPQCRPTWLR